MQAPRIDEARRNVGNGKERLRDYSVSRPEIPHRPHTKPKRKPQRSEATIAAAPTSLEAAAYPHKPLGNAQKTLISRILWETSVFLRLLAEMPLFLLDMLETLIDDRAHMAVR